MTSSFYLKLHGQPEGAPLRLPLSVRQARPGFGRAQSNICSLGLQFLHGPEQIRGGDIFFLLRDSLQLLRGEKAGRSTRTT